MDDEMGTGPGQNMASPQEVAEAIQDMVQAFRNSFPPVKEQIPAPGANRAADRALMETRGYSTAKEEAADLVFAFSSQAPLMTYVALQVEAERVMGEIRLIAGVAEEAAFGSRSAIEIEGEEPPPPLPEPLPDDQT